MALITLLGKSYAKEGSEFYFIGPLTECRDCRLKGVCFNLEPGSKYRVLEVRPQEHDCEEFDGDRVVAVAVEKIPTEAAIPKKIAIDGSVITYQNPKCDNIGCKNYMLCHAIGKKEGMKYSVTAVHDDLECPMGEKMVSVDLL